jgi:hypothetical protein
MRWTVVPLGGKNLSASDERDQGLCLSRAKGADAIVIKRNGEPLSESDLSDLIKSEADKTRNAMRA